MVLHDIQGDVRTSNAASLESIEAAPRSNLSQHTWGPFNVALHQPHTGHAAPIPAASHILRPPRLPAWCAPVPYLSHVMSHSQTMGNPFVVL